MLAPSHPRMGTETAAALHQTLRDAERELVTLTDFVRFGATLFSSEAVFFGHGTDNPVDEASALVLHALGLGPDIPVEFWQARLLPREKTDVLRLFSRRVRERKPVPYLTGRAWFAGLEFMVDERVLIPRSPIAELIAQGFQPWLEVPEPGRILDLCTGSGCIAVACADAFPSSAVTATDLCAAALEVASINVRRFGLQRQIELVHTDLFAGLSGRFDLVVCNPPYVPAWDFEGLPREYGYEPRDALLAGETGVELLHRILDQVRAHLEADGLLVLEVGTAREAFEEAYPNLTMGWPEFEHGGGDVCLIRAEALTALE